MDHRTVPDLGCPASNGLVEVDPAALPPLTAVDWTVPPPPRLVRGATGYPRVTSATICTLTRIRMRHWWFLIPSYLRYRQLGRLCRSIAGLLRFAFVIESPWTFYTISLWRDEDAITEFGNLHEHVHTARWTFARACEIWSSEWCLSGVSTRLRWDGQDLVPEDLVLHRR